MKASELLDAHFRTIKTDPQAWRALFAADAVLEMPFAPAHIPRVQKGIDAIADSVAVFLSQLGDDFRIDVKNVYRIEGEDAAFAEFSMTATVIPTGKIYSQDYILYVRARNAKITFYREYFDGARIVEAFTPNS